MEPDCDANADSKAVRITVEKALPSCYDDPWNSNLKLSLYTREVLSPHSWTVSFPV